MIRFIANHFRRAACLLSPRHTWVPLLLLFLGGLFPGCNKPKAESDILTKITVVATVYPTASIARAVGGKYVEVSWFCEYGQDPRQFKPSQQQLRLARNSDLIITSGFPDTWAGDELTSRQKNASLIQPEFTPTGLNYNDEQTAMWLHPQVAKETANMMRERFTIREPKRVEDFKTGYQQIAAEIDQVDAEYKAAFAKFKTRRFLSLRSVWNGVCKTYDVEEISPINTVAHKITVAEIAKLKKAALENETNILAIDAATLPGVQRDLEMRTGLKLLLLDNVGSSAPDANSTWPKLMRYNLEQFEKVLR